MHNANKKVFVAMSGGVDSSVAALLLKRNNYDVTGAFMRCFNLDGCAERDAEDARRVASHLGIPFYIFDFEEEYKKRVVEYMIQGYKKGITPNPDVMCNKEIKFSLFLEKALSLGADYIATGHYTHIKAKNPAKSEALAKLTEDPKKPRPSPRNIITNKNKMSMRVDNSSRGPAGNQTPGTQVTISDPDHPEHTTHSLYQAKDKNKDQSYFLWTLTQNQLKYCLFPIGNYTKKKVREIARKENLPTANKKDSQGICFLGKFSLIDFLKKHIPEKKGDILDIEGNKIGTHDGAYFYTIGQRHLGTNYKSSTSTDTKPHYVVEKNIQANTITLAEGPDNPALHKKEITLTDTNFINPASTKKEIKVCAAIRYRQNPQPATLRQLKTNSCKLIFNHSQKAIAPGQSAVLYSKKGELLGGGIITTQSRQYAHTR